MPFDFGRVRVLVYKCIYGRKVLINMQVYAYLLYKKFRLVLTVLSLCSSNYIGVFIDWFPFNPKNFVKSSAVVNIL